MVKSKTEINKIVRAYKEELRRHHIRGATILLYGSYARGNPHSCSDIDLVVISKDLNRFSPLHRQEVLAQLTMSIDAPLEVIGYTPQEFQKSHHTIFGQIIRENGKVMSG